MSDHSHESTTRVQARERSAIFLVGFMGAGKTSVGRELAEHLAWRFIDLDDRVIEREGRSIADIFGADGEPAFRKLETSALKELIEETQHGAPSVIALGGGAFVQAANEAAIRQTGFPVVFLDADVDELRRRCASAPGTRPLYKDEAQFRDLYEQRRACYERADVRIDTSLKSIHAVKEEIIEILSLKRRSL